ncbi:MAG: TetR/AcrR family transcriptional regulator [Kineosporiaceae bacterium]
MPLPRFLRLPPSQRRDILDAAATRLAAEGPGTASYASVIEATGISKSSAYQYFDGKHDLLATVLDDLRSRLAAVLGDWQRPADADDFWHRFREGGDRLRRHLVEHPVDLALAGSFADRGSAAAHEPTRTWLQSVVADGLALGVIDPGLDPELLVEATAGVLDAIDRHVLERLAAGEDPLSAGGPRLDQDLLTALWRYRR